MPRRNRSTRTERYAPTHDRGMYPLDELTDVSALEDFRSHYASQVRRLRSVHSS